MITNKFVGSVTLQSEKYAKLQVEHGFKVTKSDRMQISFKFVGASLLEVYLWLRF